MSWEKLVISSELDCLVQHTDGVTRSVAQWVKLQANPDRLNTSELDSSVNCSMFERSTCEGPPRRELDKLRQTEKELQESIAQEKKRLAALKEKSKASKRALQKEIQETVALTEQKNRTKEMAKANVKVLERKTQALKDDINEHAVFIKVMQQLPKTFMKLDEDFRCTDLRTCQHFHKVPGKCLLGTYIKGAQQ